MYPDFKKLLMVSSLLLFTGCALFPKPPVEMPEETPPVVTAPAPTPKAPAPAPAPQVKKEPEKPAPVAPAPEAPKEPLTPRAMASLELSTQAKALIEENKPDEAIRMLEQAMNLSPKNGETYYYLAEAWLLKGNPSQAAEYNALAKMRFQSDPEWAEKVKSQKLRIGQ